MILHHYAFSLMITALSYNPPMVRKFGLYKILCKDGRGVYSTVDNTKVDYKYNPALGLLLRNPLARCEKISDKYVCCVIYNSFKEK